MKKLLLVLFLFYQLSVNAQNVGIGTSTPAAALHIKGSVDTTQFIIDANKTQSGNHPLFVLRAANGVDLMHIHTNYPTNVFIGVRTGVQDLGYGSNTFLGYEAGKLNSAGYSNTAVGAIAFTSNTSGQSNTTVGEASLYENTSGSENTSVGQSALYANNTGADNTSMGVFSLFKNNAGSHNTAIGANALFSNTTANYNTAAGENALYSNVAGGYNTAVGMQAMGRSINASYNTALGLNALYNNIGDLGSYNTGLGFQALFSTTNSQYNTAIGYNAGWGHDNGYNNVFVGANTDVNGAGYYNAIAIGQGTICTGSSQVTIGNGATGSYRAYANWSNISDGRFKKNIQENVPGLDFITKLRPVTYNLNATDLDDFLHSNTADATVTNTRTADGKENKIAAQPFSDAAKAVYNKALKEKETEVTTGFVAQEVEATAKQLGFNFSGIDVPKNSNDVYGLRYAEFVVPLVKAVQEQQQMITTMQQKIAALEEQNKLLQQRIKK